MSVGLDQFAYYHHYKWDDNVFVCRGRTSDLLVLCELLKTHKIKYQESDGSNLTLVALDEAVFGDFVSCTLTRSEIDELVVVTNSLQEGPSGSHNYIDLAHGQTLYIEIL